MLSAMADYLAILQAQVASLRRKLAEERAEQDRTESWTRGAKREADHLRSQAQEVEDVLSEERERLVGLAQGVGQGRIETEACKKEVLDRQLQISWFESELAQVTEKADKKVSAGIRCGREAVERHEQAHLNLLASCRSARHAEAEAAEAEVQRLKAELAAEIEEAARQLRCSASVQLVAAADFSRHRSIVAEEQKLCESVAAELERQRQEELSRRETELENIEKETVSQRKAILARRQTEQRKREKKRKALQAKIDEAREEAAELDREVAEQEAERRRNEARMAAKRSADLATAKAEAAAAVARSEARHTSLAKALSRQPSALGPMMLANSRGPGGTKAGGLLAEFPLLGALQEIDQEISRASGATSISGIRA
jgi:hypothetical protein